MNRELPVDRRLRDKPTDTAVRDLRDLLRDVLRRLSENDASLTDHEARLVAGGL